MVYSRSVCSKRKKRTRFWYALKIVIFKRFSFSVGWDSITGFNVEKDSVEFKELMLDHTDVKHDGFSGDAQWVEELLTIFQKVSIYSIHFGSKIYYYSRNII